MSDLRVDTGALRAAAAHLRRAADFAGTARDRGSRLRDLAPGAGGSTAVGAVDHFLGEWSYGLGLIGDDAKALAEALELAAQAYEQVEADLAAGAPRAAAGEP